MKPELLPQKPLNLMSDLVRLAPPETSTKEHLCATLDYLESALETWETEQDARLQKAEKRVRLCAYLKGMISAFGFHSSSKHFDWCPFEAWMAPDLLDIEDILKENRPK